MDFCVRPLEASMNQSPNLNFSFLFLLLRRLYYVAMSIGNPPRPYFLDVDTGSDLTWLQCDAPCVSCSKVVAFFSSWDPPPPTCNVHIW
jgi:hypothetical protein